MPETPNRTAWPRSLRLGFRFLFLYLVQFALGSNHKTVFEKVPEFGVKLQGLLNLPYLRLSQWMAVHWLYLVGPAAVPHASGFGDRALDWLTAGLMVAIAIMGTAVWSGFARGRDEAQREETLWLYLRFLLRLTVAVAMLWYGSIKLWPIQIESPSLAVLNEPVGNLSPMTLLWTLLGSNHTYEFVCGLVETLCGLLLLWRRTALAGALLAVVIMANVVLFDVFFDVPVRLYAANLLLMAVVMAAPDLPGVFDLLLRRRAVLLTSRWVPVARTRVGRYGFVAAELVLVLVFLKGFVNHAQYTREAAGERSPPALAGEWHLEASVRGGEAVAFRTAAGSPLVDLYLEPNGRTTLRAADGTLHGGGTYAGDRVTLAGYLLQGSRFRVEQTDAAHLVLVPESAADPELRLTRVALPGRYPLYERRPQLVNEFGYER